MPQLEIDDRYVDVYFPSEPEYVAGDLGAPLFASAFGDYEAEEELLTDSQIHEAAERQEEEGSLEWFVRWVLNQGREGSCVGNAATALMQILIAQMLGIENAIQLSAISLYKQIGRSASSGAMVSDGFKALMDVGLLPLNTPENQAKYAHTMPATGFSTPFPSGWKETAAKFRIAGGKVVRSPRGLNSLLAKGRGVLVGREGHAILYLGLRRRNGSLIYPYLNSWDIKWGQALGRLSGGFGFDTERQAQKSASWAYTIDSVRMAA